MPVSVTLPALGESVTEGTVTRWLKAEGERVEADEPLLEVSTDKVDTEIPAPASGVLSSIRVAEDETVEVGAELAVIDDGTGAPAGAPAAAEAPAPAQEAQAPAPARETPAQPAPAQEAPQAAPSTEAAAPAPAEAAEAASGGGSAEGTDVVLPALGESVTEGTVTRWLKQVGESVEADEPLLEVSTDKVDTEIPAPTSGTLLEITVGEDETAEVGAKLGVIGAAGAAPAAQAPAAPAPAEAAPPAPAPEPEPEPEPAAQAPVQAPPTQPAPAPAEPAPTAEAASAPAPEPAAAQPAPAQPSPAPAAARATDEGVYVTPLVRKLAAEHGVDLASVKGTGVGGRVRKQDVVAAAEVAKAPAAPAPAPAAAPAAKAPEASPLRGQTVKMTRMRKVIGDNMMKALHGQAQLSSVVEVDITRLMRLRARAKDAFAAREGVKLSPMPFFVKAAAQALKAHPVINARINEDEGTVTYFDSENIGIAVDSEKGLMTPVIKGAGDLNIAGVAKATADLAAKVRGGKITPDELAGATFTISNTGSRGALFDTIIVPPNQVAILGVGATVKRPVVLDHPELGETIAVRHMTYLTLSYDHRLVDGADAARYLGAVKAILEAGEFEVDLGL